MGLLGKIMLAKTPGALLYAHHSCLKAYILRYAAVPVKMIKVFLIRLGPKEIEVPNLKIGPKVAKIVVSVWCSDKWKQISPRYEFRILFHEFLGGSPEGGNSVGKLQDGNHKSIFQLVLLQRKPFLSSGPQDSSSGLCSKSQ